MTDLRTRLHDVADEVTPLPVADDLWQRGVTARRRGQAVLVAAVVALVVSVAGTATLLGQDDREARTASGEVVEGGAIPSRIVDADVPSFEGLAFGRASVAYVDQSGQPVLIGATTGTARHIDLPDFPDAYYDAMTDQFTGPWLALSPDGTKVAYPVGTERQLVRRGPLVFGADWYRVVDLVSGTPSLLPPVTDAAPSAISWTSRGRVAVDSTDGRSWTFDPVTGAGGAAELSGVVSPSDGLSAPYPQDDRLVRAMPFTSADGADLVRRLPSDLYPDGASITPVGWADTSLLVGEVDAPAGSYVEGRHLVLFTSPDRPEVEWTYRIMVRDVPPVASLSLAVDLVPDLDGTSAQQLTHDFGDVLAPDDRDILWIIGLGVAAAIAVLLALRWLWRRPRQG